MNAIPSYAVDLLFAAKSVAQPPSGATPEMLAEHLDRLCDAVNAFEKRMPLADGTIQEATPDPAFESDSSGRRVAAEAMMNLQAGAPQGDVVRKTVRYLLMDAWGEEPKCEVVAFFEGFLGQLFEIAKITQLREAL